MGEHNRSENVAVHCAAMTTPLIQYNTIGSRYVEESVDHGMECYMRVLCGVIWSMVGNSDCDSGFSVCVCFMIVRSRKIILLLTSISKVKFNIGCSLLMYGCSCLVCLLFPLYRSIMSLKYLYQYMNESMGILVICVMEKESGIMTANICNKQYNQLDRYCEWI